MTSSVNDAVLESLETSINYEDIINVTKDNQGNISFMSVDSIKVNQINREVAKKAQENLKEYENKGIPVPVGTLSGISLLAGVGKPINLAVIATGNVSCKFTSLFESKGVNQTLHSIYLEVNAVVNLEIPLSYSTIDSKSQVLLCETILVGEVPNAYVNGLFK